VTSAETPLWPDNPTAEDLLGFRDIAEPIMDALMRDRLDPIAVGVFGDWGSGKSTVLEIIGSDLAPDGQDEHDSDSEGDNKVVIVQTRPWEYDPKVDPKATLIDEVLSAVKAAAEERKSGLGKMTEKFEALAARIKWSKAITMVADSALTLSLPKISDIADVFGPKEGPEDPTLRGFRQEFGALMSELPEIERVVVLVDDLDRCLPETVVAALEAMKLFLSVQKMAFVIAADRRLVTLAIAKSYGSSAQGLEFARQYLEKMVQIPVTVPVLGLADTEAYLAMMLAQGELDAETFRKLVEHCDGRRQAGEARVLEGCQDGLLPDKAGPAIQLAGVLAPVLSKRLEGNPRRIKRFLNAFWLRSAIAERRGATLEPGALAKLLILEELDPVAFSQLISWLAGGELKERLEELEKPGEDDGSDGMREWAQVSPALAGEELGPYLRLAASLRSLSTPGGQLRSELRKLLKELTATTQTKRKAARKSLAKLGSEDRLEMSRALCEIARTEPDQQDSAAESLEELIQDGALAAEIVLRLGEIDAEAVRPGLIVRISGDGPAKADAIGLVERWSASGRLPEVSQAAAQTVAGGGGK
jgi:hypothetical protein